MGPLLESGDESILREFLGKTNVTQDARETGDDPGGLDAPDCVDGAMCIGSRHGYRSHHVRSVGASRGNADHFFAASERSYGLGAKSSGPRSWRTSVSPSQPGQCFL